ncbi:MAG: hypothetical protein AAGI25_20900 [Bacteroidota bacterium]
MTAGLSGYFLFFDGRTAEDELGLEGFSKNIRLYAIHKERSIFQLTFLKKVTNRFGLY